MRPAENSRPQRPSPARAPRTWEGTAGCGPRWGLSKRTCLFLSLATCGSADWPRRCQGMLRKRPGAPRQEQHSLWVWGQRRTGFGSALRSRMKGCPGGHRAELAAMQPGVVGSAAKLWASELLPTGPHQASCCCPEAPRLLQRCQTLAGLWLDKSLTLRPAEDEAGHSCHLQEHLESLGHSPSHRPGGCLECSSAPPGSGPTC